MGSPPGGTYHLPSSAATKFRERGAVHMPSGARVVSQAVSEAVSRARVVSQAVSCERRRAGGRRAGRARSSQERNESRAGRWDRREGRWGRRSSTRARPESVRRTVRDGAARRAAGDNEDERRAGEQRRRRARGRAGHGRAGHASLRAGAPAACRVALQQFASHLSAKQPSVCLWKRPKTEFFHSPVCLSRSVEPGPNRQPTGHR